MRTKASDTRDLRMRPSESPLITIASRGGASSSKRLMIIRMGAARKVRINRAPVLTLWAAVVAERLGYDREEALTLGKAVAGLNAQSKGRRLGIYHEPEEKPARPRAAKTVELLGRRIPISRTKAGV